MPSGRMVARADKHGPPQCLHAPPQRCRLLRCPLTPSAIYIRVRAPFYYRLPGDDDGMMMAQRDMRSYDVAWFDWWEVQEALAHARAGGIALHYFRYDLRRFGLGRDEPACHILSADHASLVAFGSAFGLRREWLEAPRRHRPEVWHFDAFGPLLERLLEVYPLPAAIGHGEPAPASDDSASEADTDSTGAERPEQGTLP